MLFRMVEITSPEGLNAAAAALLVKTASAFAAAIHLEKDHKKINAKSIMGVISLGVKKGDILILSAEGKDEEAAANALEALAEKQFKL